MNNSPGSSTNAKAHNTNETRTNRRGKRLMTTASFWLEGDKIETLEEHKNDKSSDLLNRKTKFETSQTENLESFPQHYTSSMTPTDIKAENSNLRPADDNKE